MGIFGRLGDLLSANVNDLMDRAENPEKMMKQIIRELEDQIVTCKKEAATILATVKRMEKDLDAKAKQVADWQNRAEMAVQGGEDDLARKALERKLAYQKEMDALQGQVDDTNTAAESMKNTITQLEEKLVEARSKFKSLVARGQAAKSQQKTQKTIAKLSNPAGVMNKLERMEQRVEDMENEASAAAALKNASDELEREFSTREKDLAVESELAALKASRNQ